MLLTKILLLLVSSIVVSSQKSSDVSSAVVTVSGGIATPSVEKSTSLIPTNRVTASTASTLPMVSTTNSIVKSTGTVSIPTISMSIKSTPTVSTSIKSTPTVSASISNKNSTLTGSIPDFLNEVVDFDLEEAPYTGDDLSVEDSIDLTAYELEVYAADVASGEHKTMAPGDVEGAKVVLPVCPDVSQIAGLSTREVKKKPVFNCSPEMLSIKVYVHYFTEKEITPAALAIVEAKMKKQFIFIQVLFWKTLRVQLEWYETIDYRVAPGFGRHIILLKDVQSKDEITKHNKAVLQSSRGGGADTLNIWIVDNIHNQETVNGKTVYSSINSYSYRPGQKLFQIDGIVIGERLLGAGEIITETDKCTKQPKPRIMGGTLLHELGHWMGLKHTFHGGCAGANDDIGDSFAFQEDIATKHCCYQKKCVGKTTPNAPIRVQNWMSDSICRGTYDDDSFREYSFTPGQKAMVYAQFLTFRRKKPCNAKVDGALGSRSTEEHVVLQKREADKATILADLLLQNCSVAIQAVFQEDSIPLPKSVLQSYSSVASSMQAHPTSYPPGADRPTTATHGSAPASTATGGVNAADKKNDSGGNGKASMFGFAGWFFGLLLML